jgi:hypothetical protein
VACLREVSVGSLGVALPAVSAPLAVPAAVPSSQQVTCRMALVPAAVCLSSLIAFS